MATKIVKPLNFYHLDWSSSQQDNFAVEKQNWPSLNLISKLNVIPNGRNRRQFPNPLLDKYLQFSCQFSKNETKTVRFIKTNIDYTFDNWNSLQVQQCQSDLEIDHENCEFFISLDDIYTDNSAPLSKSVMLCDIREHSMSSKLLSDKVTGLWIRLFGPKTKFTFIFSLYQYLGRKRNGKLQRSKLMRMNELKVEVWNEGPLIKKPVKKVNFDIQSSFQNKDFAGNDHFPTFCSKELFKKITSSLHDCLDNGKFEDFFKLCNMFKEDDEIMNSNNTDPIELRLLLSIEKSLYHATKAEFVKAKKQLQHVVGSIISKNPNKVFLLNMAYSSLANVHLMEGNFGTAEDCLNVLQYDKKHGIPYEQVGYFYLLNGEMLMNFSKKTCEMRERLLQESDMSFKKSEESLQKCLPHSFERLCKLNLLRARLYICEHYGNCCGSNFDKATKFKQNVEKDFDLLSLRSKCHLYLVQSECYFYEEKYDEAEAKFNDFQNMFSIFPEFSLVIKKIKQQREHVIKSKKSSSLNDLNFSNLDYYYYDADESS